MSGRPAADVANSSLGADFDGMLAQYVTLNEQGVVLPPKHLSFEEGAPLPCAAIAAWNGLVTRGRMQAGDFVLLEGTGGVSIFGLQFAAAATYPWMGYGQHSSLQVGGRVPAQIRTVKKTRIF